MASLAVARAHITVQEQIRAATVRAVAAIWKALPGHDDVNLDEWLTKVLPVVAIAQRSSVTATEAFLAHVLGRQPLGVNPADFIGAAARNGVDPAAVYRRPFVTVWSALAREVLLPEALRMGLTRAGTTAETDVQLTMRATLRGVGQADPSIAGYQRVLDGAACGFCAAAAAQTYATADLMPIHVRCGCGVDVITTAARPDFSPPGAAELPRTADGQPVAVREHGELGPVLVNADWAFTSERDLSH